MTIDELKKEFCQERVKIGHSPFLDRTLVDGSWRPTDEYVEWLEQKLIQSDCPYCGKRIKP